MKKECPVCHKVITYRAYLCTDCYDRYGSIKENWPPWLEWLVRDYERERMSERRWVVRMDSEVGLACEDRYILEVPMDAAQKKVWDAVIERDQGRCALCSRPASEVHHIIPRSHFGKRSKICWQLKNMMCLCKECHGDWQHTKAARRAALIYLRRAFKYNYKGQPWEAALYAEE